MERGTEDKHTPILLMVLPSLSTLVAPQAPVARHRADNHVLNHIVLNAIVPPPNSGKKRITQAQQERRETKTGNDSKKESKEGGKGRKGWADSRYAK